LVCQVPSKRSAATDAAGSGSKTMPTRRPADFFIMSLGGPIVCRTTTACKAESDVREGAQVVPATEGKEGIRSNRTVRCLHRTVRAALFQPVDRLEFLVRQSLRQRSVRERLDFALARLHDP